MPPTHAWSPSGAHAQRWDDFDEPVYRPDGIWDAPDDSSSLKAGVGKLIGQWKKETQFMSSPSQMTAVPSYWELLRLGDEAVPFLLHDLRKSASDLFVVLQNITGDNPVPAQSYGKLDEIVDAWVQWGISHNYIVDPKTYE
jgi:hypothetical protein